jgi:RNA polymerase primary sigma factor
MFSASVASAFLLHPAAKWQYRESLHRRSSTILDVDTELIRVTGNRQPQELGDLTSSSLDREDPSYPRRNKRIQFKGITTLNKKTLTDNPDIEIIKLPGKPARSRSSTMPGFSAETDRQRAFKDGIRLAERHSGRTFKESAEAKRRRCEIDSTRMYQESASIPNSLIQYAKDIHQEDRITSDEEKNLGESVQEAVRLQRLYDRLEMKLSREPTDQEWCAAAGKINIEAIRQDIEAGVEAKNKLVTSNLRMVQSVVNTYIRNGLAARYNAADMMSEGVLALIRAAEKFEPQRGWRFSTYGMYWIRSAVKRSFIFQSRIITVPQRMTDNHKRLLRVEKELYSALGRKPTRKEIGQAVGMSETQVDRCFTAMEGRCFSLDQPVKNTLKSMGDDALGNTLAEVTENRVKAGESEFNRRLIREDIINILKRHLSPHEVEILLLRFGLNDNSISSGKITTVSQLSDILGIKPTKVRMTINSSLKKLRGVEFEEWRHYL